jgi:hypothetical protein
MTLTIVGGGGGRYSFELNKKKSLGKKSQQDPEQH